MAEPWRVAILSMVLPPTRGLDALVRGLGHEPVVLVTPRVGPDALPARLERHRELLADVPEGLDLCVVADRAGLVRALRAYELDLAVCAGYAWRLPPEAIAATRLGVVNGHPSLLPRHRGPFPFAWAVRLGDPELGMTFHLMDEDFDTGPILAQGSRPMPEEPSFETFQPLLAELGAELLPQAFARLEAGDRGDPQPAGGATYAGPFGDDYAEVDLSRAREEVHRQVAAWRLVFGQPLGPFVDLDGARVRLVRTSLAEPESAAPRLEAADGPLWVLEHEPA
ncbi:MAG TPA: formyltransferase family protein [Gaiellaceae bacterium]|nr:formyltransferase family protein [Gaiellaceae bacterium]